MPSGGKICPLRTGPAARYSLARCLMQRMFAVPHCGPSPLCAGSGRQRRERCKEIFLLQASGLAGRLEHVGSKGCVLGISGGLDSTLALLVAVRAMELLGKPASAVLGVTMPGFGTTDRTYRNALDLMEALGVTRREISIADACVQHMADIGHDPSVHDITYENTQARERTQILL